MFYRGQFQKSEGLTLIEILISIVILVVGIFAVMSMLSSAVKGNAKARKMTRALNIAESKMDEFLHNGNCSGQNQTEGVFEWSRIPNPSISPRYCRVTVTWIIYGQNKQISLETLKME